MEKSLDKIINRDVQNSPLTGAWESLHQQLDLSSHALVPVMPNFVDEIWDDRPPRPHKPLLHLSLEFTGSSVGQLHCVQ